MLDDILFLKDLNDQEKLLFQNEYLSVKKNPTTGVILTLFLGGIGGHHFYMGNIGLGVLYAIFCWTFVPVIVSLIELFLMTTRVDRYNREKAQEIFVKLKAIRPHGAV
jgi:TM2 domain-containing membrane protein YozV